MKKEVDTRWAFGQSRTDDRGFNQGWVMNEATRVRAERRSDYMISKLDLKAGRNVLEIGCGPGFNAYTIAKKTGASVLGVDICKPFIEEAATNFQLPHLRYEIHDFNQADQFKGETFDCIMGNGILHHLYYHLDTALMNIRRLLKPGGKICFLEPNIYNPYVSLIFNFSSLRRWARLEPDEMAFSRQFVAGKLEKAGYRNIEIQFRDFLLPGIPSFLIQPSIQAGALLEKIPVINYLAQSLFINAEN